MSGKFITFEGIDGSGKSTQAALFADFLRDAGHDVVLTKDPGGGKISAMIREILVNGDPDSMDGVTELLLFTAARRDLVRNVIRPALTAGKWVVCDRYCDSTIAYQWFGNDLKSKYVDDFWCSLGTAGYDGLWPYLTFLIDVPVNVGMDRVKSRDNSETRFERKGTAYMEKVRTGFIWCMTHYQGRVLLINGERSVFDVHETILQVTKKRWDQ